MRPNPNQIQLGEDAKNDALERVERHAEPEWYEAARRALWHVCQHADTLTTDDVWAHLDAAGAPPPHEPRAMGALIRRAATRGIITPTGDYTKSQRPENHRRPVAVWRVTRRVSSTE